MKVSKQPPPIPASAVQWGLCAAQRALQRPVRGWGAQGLKPGRECRLEAQKPGSLTELWVRTGNFGSLEEEGPKGLGLVPKRRQPPDKTVKGKVKGLVGRRRPGSGGLSSDL